MSTLPSLQLHSTTTLQIQYVDMVCAAAVTGHVQGVNHYRTSLPICCVVMQCHEADWSCHVQWAEAQQALQTPDRLCNAGRVNLLFH